MWEGVSAAWEEPLAGRAGEEGEREEERGERTEAAGAAAKDLNSGATVWIVATVHFRQKQGVFWSSYDVKIGDENQEPTCCNQNT